jgi:hypothetical protein
VMGLFMAVLLAGLMYSLVGIGDAIVQRERMQDAADAAALSGAVLHARGMNTLVLINLTMAALLAILVALKLAEAVVGVAMVVAYAIAIFTPAAAPAAEVLRATRVTISKSHSALSKVIHPTLEALHGLSRGVRVAVPWGAQARAVQLVHAHYDPPAHVGFLLPLNLALPTEDGEFSVLCDRAGDLVGDLAALPFAIPGLGPVRDAIDGAIEDLAKAGAGWFCGPGGASAPSTTLRYEVNEPVLPARQACLEYGPDDAGFTPAEQARRCQLADREERAATPDPGSGACTTRCERGGPYDQRVTLARAACDPSAHDDLRAFRWQERTLERTWVFRRGHWQLEHEEAGAPRLVAAGDHDRRPPCGRGGSVAEGWSSEAWRDDTGMEPLPLCSDAQLPPAGRREGQRFVDEATEVLQLFGCKRDAKTRIEVDDVADDPSQQLDDRKRKKMLPQVMRAGVHLGDEAFQVRSVVIGALPDRAPTGAVKAAGWRDARTKGQSIAVPEKLLSAARRLGHLSLAQAEYYYAVTDAAKPDPASWMWNMRWQARLRRLRVPEGEPDRDGGDERRDMGLDPAARSAGEACRLAGGGDEGDPGCALAEDLGRGLLEEVTEWIVH